MNENTEKRNIWTRALFMLLMALAYHVCGTVLFVISLVQFVIVLAGGTPNARLVLFGRSLAHYYRQIVIFMTFATEEKPFPFNDWPTKDTV